MKQQRLQYENMRSMSEYCNRRNCRQYVLYDVEPKKERLFMKLFARFFAVATLTKILTRQIARAVVIHAHRATKREGSIYDQDLRTEGQQWGNCCRTTSMAWKQFNVMREFLHRTMCMKSTSTLATLQTKFVGHMAGSTRNWQSHQNLMLSLAKPKCPKFDGPGTICHQKN